MIHRQRHQADAPLGDGEMRGTVVAEEDDVIDEVGQIEFGERCRRAEQVHDLHGLGVLDLALARDRNVAPVSSVLPAMTEVTMFSYSLPGWPS